MRRLSYFLACSMSLVAMTGYKASAASQPTPLIPTVGSTSELLVANRLPRGLSFRVSASRYRRGGFSRGSCPEGAAPVVPVAEDETAAPTYLTASSHPTFFINVPEMPDASGFVYVEDPNSAQRNPQLYKAAFDLSGDAGIVGIEMPESAPALQEGGNYRWRVVINCSTGEGEENTIVFSGGEVERVANISGTTQEKLDYYLSEGIWQETAAILATDRYADTSATADEDWAVLMEASGIPEFADTPIVAILESELSDD